jgi:hypothetical protein
MVAEKVHRRLLPPGNFPSQGAWRADPVHATDRAASTHPRSGDGRETKLCPQRGAERVQCLGAERLVG